MGNACYCDDGERPSLYHAQRVKARLRHKCYECFGPIMPGEVYEVVSSLFDGAFSLTKTCPRCLSVRDYMEAHAPCFCWLHGSMLEDAKDTLREYAHLSDGFWIGGMKRVLRAEKGGNRC